MVEKNVQDSRRRIWQEAAERRFATLMKLNAWLEQRCRALWRELRHPQHEQLFVGVGAQGHLDVAQALAPSQLSKRHHAKLLRQLMRRTRVLPE